VHRMPCRTSPVLPDYPNWRQAGYLDFYVRSPDFKMLVMNFKFKVKHTQARKNTSVGYQFTIS
jgi:hypothetical protein